MLLPEPVINPDVYDNIGNDLVQMVNRNIEQPGVSEFYADGVMQEPGVPEAYMQGNESVADANGVN